MRAWAAERQQGKRIPKFCPERHLNGDGSFCLGLTPHRIETVQKAEWWWRDLQQFLFLQVVADETGAWPQSSALSHGRAAYNELAAREAARLIGLDPAYTEMLEGETNWLSRLFEEQGACAVNLPRRWRPNGEGAPLVPPHQRKAFRLNIQILLRAEQNRRSALTKFWADWKSSRARCCGTMNTCPLRE